MASIAALNPKAEYAKSQNAFNINLTAARGLFDVLKSNLGPKGTLKMLVSGAGDIKLTKDGNVCLQEMQIKHPTASLIARAATAQDDITGDGTTTIVLMISELLKQADGLMYDGLYMQYLHPTIITEGFSLAKVRALDVLERLTIADKVDRAVLINVAGTAVKTKLHYDLARELSEHIVDAVLAVKQSDATQGEELDLHRVEIMQMQHKRDMDSTLIRGLVLDHGGRHPDMPKRVKNAFILTLNVSMEYEKTEINSGFFYKSAVEREKLVQAEREFIDERVRKVIELKRRVCDEGAGAHPARGDTKSGFVMINQKGIDPFSLDMLAKEGILALRRAKRRNMERLALACGGWAVNCVDELAPECLGRAGLVTEMALGDDKFTFVEECANPQSVTLLIKGPNKHTLTQIRDAVNDGLKAVKNAIVDARVVPGAGAFELAAHLELMRYSQSVAGRAAYGVEAFARALLVIPRVLAQNSGFDVKDAEVKLLREIRALMEPASEGGAARLSGETVLGIDLDSGEPMRPLEKGVLDNYCVKKQILNSACEIAKNLLLVDEMMRAGLESLKG